METIALLTNITEYSRAVFKVKDLDLANGKLKFYTRLWSTWHESSSKNFKVLMVRNKE